MSERRMLCKCGAALTADEQQSGQWCIECRAEAILQRDPVPTFLPDFMIDEDEAIVRSTAELKPERKAVEVRRQSGLVGGLIDTVTHWLRSALRLP
jgi:hypothetical protein